MATCNRCGTMFTRKGNLKRHQKDRCKGVSRVEGDPQISDIINAVINNGIAAKPKYIDFTPPPPPSKKQKMSPSVNLLPLEFGDDASESDSDYDSDTDSDHASTNAVDKIKYNINDLPVINDDNVDVDDLSPPPPPNKIKFLPETVAGLTNRFNELFPKYWRGNKERNVHNELVSLLDALLKQNGITRTIYKKMNNMVSSGDGIDEEEEKEEEEDENTLEGKISDTVEYLIRHDRSEIGELLNTFESEELFKDDVTRLRKLTEEWVQNEILGKEFLLDDIEQILRKLKSSTIHKSKLHRFKMLLKEIRVNRYRVSNIVHRMNVILSGENVNKKEISDGLKNLISGNLINDEQYKALQNKIDDLDVDNLIWEIKSVKVGRGLEFLPRKTHDLLEKLKEWVGEFGVEGTAALRQKILGVLDELLFRKVISKNVYKDVKSDID